MARTMATEDDTSSSDDDKTILDVPLNPVPLDVDDDVSSSSGDFFTYVLIAYAIFAVGDSIFHFVPNDRTYVELFRDAIVGVVTSTDGGGGDVGTP